MWPTPHSTRLTRCCIDGEAAFEVAGAGTLLQRIAEQLGDVPEPARTALARVMLDAMVLDSVLARLRAARGRASANAVHRRS